MPRLVAVWKFGGADHRLVEVSDDKWTLERCDRATPGFELWTPVFESHGMIFRDGGKLGYAIKAMISAIDQNARERAAFSRSFDYSTGEGF